MPPTHYRPPHVRRSECLPEQLVVPPRTHFLLQAVHGTCWASLSRTFGGVQGQRGAATSWSAAPLSIFRAAPIANWQEAGLPKTAFASNGITALELIPFHQKGGRAALRGEAHYTPLGGSWLNMAESVQRVLKRRALDGQHPESPAQIGAWVEQTARAWNQQPTSFTWNGKRRQRRRKHPGDAYAISGSAAHARYPLLHRRTNYQEWQASCQMTH